MNRRGSLNRAAVTRTLKIKKNMSRAGEGNKGRGSTGKKKEMGMRVSKNHQRTRCSTREKR